MPKKKKVKTGKNGIDPEEIIIGLNTRKQKDNPPIGKKKTKKSNKKKKKKIKQNKEVIPKKVKKKKQRKKRKGTLKKILKILLQLIIVIRACSRDNYIPICITSI